MKSKVFKKLPAGQRPAVKPRTEDHYYVPGSPHPLNGVYPRIRLENASLPRA